MANLSREKFSVLEINVYEENRLLQKYKPKLKDIFGPLTKYRREDLDNLIRYIFFMYDRNSPMREFYSDINERKEASAVLAGYENLEKKKVKDIFSLEDEVARDLIHKLLRHQSGMIWSALATNYELFWQYQREMLAPIEESRDDKNKLDALKVKGVLAGEIDVILQRIKTYEDQLFGDDSDAEKYLSPTSPEAIADVRKA